MTQPLDYARPAAKPPRRTHPLTWAVAAIFGALVIASMLAPPTPRAREPANRVRCASNLKQIGQAMILYANDHQGQFPDSLALLVLEEDLTTNTFICPSSNDEPASGPTTQATLANLQAPGHLSYIYVAKGMTNTATPNTILAHEPLSNHQNKGMNVLFGDGHVEWIDANAAAKILAELNTGHNPPRKENLK